MGLTNVKHQHETRAHHPFALSLERIGGMG
jgi:hypothetical protein